MGVLNATNQMGRSPHKPKIGLPITRNLHGEQNLSFVFLSYLCHTQVPLCWFWKWRAWLYQPKTVLGRGSRSLAYILGQGEHSFPCILCVPDYIIYFCHMPYILGQGVHSSIATSPSSMSLWAWIEHCFSGLGEPILLQAGQLSNSPLGPGWGTKWIFFCIFTNTRKAWQYIHLCDQGEYVDCVEENFKVQIR